MARHPNILTIMTDQQFAGAMSCAGDANLKTPGMDSLATRGVRFPNAYSSYPLCVPARMSMFTSRMPHEFGIFANTKIVDRDLGVPMLGRLVADAGYHTHYIGKWHLTVPEERAEWHGFPTIEYGGGYGGKDSDKTGSAITFLEQQKGSEQPWFLTVSYNNPHDCCELARGTDLKMGELPALPPDDQLPPMPGNSAIPEGEPEVLRVFQNDNERVGRAQNWNEIQTRQFIWGYSRLVEMVDAEIELLLMALDENGHKENTVVIFSSDHGDGIGRHRWNQKWSLYDESARVPCIISGPGVADAGRVDETLVAASLDLMPTILDYAGAEMPADMRGHSLRPAAESRDDEEREAVFSETSLQNWAELGVKKGAMGRMVRTQRYKYICFDSGQQREQLFDMQEDPGETHSLLCEPGFTDILSYHRTLLEEWIEQTDDPFDVG